MITKIILCVLAAVIFGLLAFKVIDQDFMLWLSGALGLFALSTLPWPN